MAPLFLLEKANGNKRKLGQSATVCPGSQNAIIQFMHCPDVRLTVTLRAGFTFDAFAVSASDTTVW